MDPLQLDARGLFTWAHHPTGEFARTVGHHHASPGEQRARRQPTEAPEDGQGDGNFDNHVPASIVPPRQILVGSKIAFL